MKNLLLCLLLLLLFTRCSEKEKNHTPPPKYDTTSLGQRYLTFDSLLPNFEVIPFDDLVYFKELTRYHFRGRKANFNRDLYFHFAEEWLNHYDENIAVSKRFPSCLKMRQHFPNRDCHTWEAIIQTTKALLPDNENWTKPYVIGRFLFPGGDIGILLALPGPEVKTGYWSGSFLLRFSTTGDFHTMIPFQYKNVVQHHANRPVRYWYDRIHRIYVSEISDSTLVQVDSLWTYKNRRQYPDSLFSWKYFHSWDPKSMEYRLDSTHSEAIRCRNKSCNP